MTRSATLVLGLFLLAAAAQAQNYPARPVKIVSGAKVD